MASAIKRQDSNWSEPASAAASEMDSGDDAFMNDDDDDDADDDDFGVAAAAGAAGADDDAEDAVEVGRVLSAAGILDAMLEQIKDVNTIFQISSGTARKLLEHFKWDKERLIERYYDGDQDKLFAEAHVVNPFSASERPAVDPASEVECQICMVDYPAGDMAGLECGHLFCNDCWTAYLRGKILDQGTAVIPCAASDCSIHVDELTMTRLITDPAVLSKYKYVIAKEFVLRNRFVKWCPAPGCENAVQVSSLKPAVVQCGCGHRFCFGCTQVAHVPLVCDMFGLWLRKCADDSETANWISANTKDCPKCKGTIEKNGGCNHITCKSAACGYEFCWMCLGPWQPHGSSWYNCNRFEESDAKEARSAQEQSRHALEKYLFYFNRYANHNESKKLECKLEEMVAAKMEELQRVHSMSWIEAQFLKKALATLSQCRETLKFTYVFAYYLVKNTHCMMFEDNQKDLELATEELSHYLEGKAATDNIETLKQGVLDKTKYCSARREKLVHHVQEGMRDGIWKYQPDSVDAMMQAAAAQFQK